ncbi:MAG: thymidine kinase [Verrucomicrobiaceae bacterium]|nr:MAG: thymidine kinase [Verrucomicrobiaceae bacterium]
MSYGTLTVVCGPMFAGKSTEVLKRVLWAKNGLRRPVAVFKPSFDNRYAETEIVSHDGLRTPAQSIAALPERVTFSELVIKPRAALIVLDECQFFEPPYVEGDTVEWVRTRLAAGFDFIAAGLDMDWQGKPFRVTADLIAMADEVVKVSANCTVCGRNAPKTYKLTPEGGSVELGAQDKYEARCNEHWFNRT